MTNKQTPINSGFGADTTAAEVLKDIDLSGKLAIVTGGHSGLGLETTRALAGAGAHVIIGARNPETVRANVTGIAKTTIEALDLADLASVRAFADRFLAGGRTVDIIINSAGIMACPETRVGLGWEAQFATNHLGHFALVNRMWPAIADGGRVVSVSSAGHHNSAMRWDDVQFEGGYDKWQAYGQSKTANALFAVQLDLYGLNRGIRAFSLHPGKIFTPLQRHLTTQEMVEAGWIDANGDPADSTFKTTAQGAATQVWAATAPQLDGMGGLYCEDCDVAKLWTTDSAPFDGVRDYAVDPDQAERLWALSAELTGVDAFASRT